MEATARTIQVHDVITIGGMAFEVTNLSDLPYGAKQLRFASGESMTMHAKTRLPVTRAVRKW
ncbi:hypothetical protein ACIA78_28955 [Streptomyces xanthochromogenes]|uniref:hypothetical protein n=1 Tax=Streptomyces xanthochromogenes TaxID=67384 RepID=UPI0037AD6D5B